MFQNTQDKVQELKNKTKELAKFCLKMENDYNFYYEGLNTIENIIKEIHSQIAEFNKRISQEVVLTDIEKKALEIEKINLIDNLKKWEQEARDYVQENLDIKKQLRSLGVTTENCNKFPLNSVYNSLVKGVAIKYNLKNAEKISEQDLLKMEEQINEIYKKAFKISDNLIENDFTKMAEEISKEEFDEIRNRSYEKITTPIDAPFVFQDEEPEKSKNSYDIFENIQEPEITLEEMLANIDIKGEKARETIKESSKEEPYSIPSFLKENYEENSKEESQKRADLLEEAINKREENYNHYRTTLYKRMDQYEEDKRSFNEEINKRMLVNESFDDISNRYNHEKEIQELVFKEITRVNSIIPESRKNVDLNLNIPNADMSINKIIEHLRMNEPYEFLEIPKKELKTYPMITGTPKMLTKNEPELEIPEDLKLIQKYKKAGLTNDEIYIVLNAIEKQKKNEEIGKKFKWVKIASDKTKQFVEKSKNYLIMKSMASLIKKEAKRTVKNSQFLREGDPDYKLGKLFHFTKKTVEKTSKYVKEHKKELLITAGASVVLASVVTIAANSNKPFIDSKNNQVTIEHQTNKEIFDLEKDIKSELDNNTKMPPIHIEINDVKDQYSYMNIGEKIVPNSGASIYDNQYIDVKMQPYYGYDVERDIVSFGIMNEKGEVIQAYDEKTRQEMIQAGGKYVSVETFDGFWDINEVKTIEKGLGL